MKKQTKNLCGIEALKSVKRKCMVIGMALLLIIGILGIYFVSKGAMDIGFGRTWQIFWANITGNNSLLANIKDNEIAVVMEIRLPRVICGVFVGAGLAMAGTMFQALLRNPLADPCTLGVSTGAAFGASIAIYMGIMYGIIVSTTLFAFVAAFITLVFVIFVAQKGGGLYSSNLIISGIIISSILSSGISFIKMLAGENVSAIVFWLMGSLASKSWHDVHIIVPMVIIGGLIAYFFANDLNIMTVGENNAKTLGVNTKQIRFIYLVTGSCITAVCVAVSGIIGFIGLVIPHILRYWLTSDNRILIPLSAVLGGIILSMADNFTRLLFVSEIPVGVLTTLIGGPFFIYVFISRQKQ